MPSPIGYSIDSIDLGFTLPAPSLDQVAQDGQLPNEAEPVSSNLNQ